MKKLSIIVSLSLLALSGCDAPEKVRYDNSLGASNASNTLTDSGTTSGSTTGTTTGSNNGNSQPTGFQNCNTNPTYYAASTGQMSVCQSSANELKIRLGFTTANSNQNDQTCIIPMHKDGSGNSFYIGSAQCTNHTVGQVIYGDMVKNRAGYTNYNLNAVMIMKYSSTTAFFQCMNGYASGFLACPSLPAVNAQCISQTPNCVMNQNCINYNCGVSPALYNTCASYASNYMTGLCNTFTTNHSYFTVNF
jgi:hypothetical protein